jgi:hypothetical protein
MYGQTGILEVTGLYALTDSYDYTTAWNADVFCVEILYGCSAVCIDFAYHLRSHPEACYIAVVVCFNAHGSSEGEYFAAFRYRRLHLGRHCGHVHLSSAIYDSYFACAKSDRRARRIHSYVAAADHDADLYACFDALPDHVAHSADDREVQSPVRVARKGFAADLE